ncbi:carbon-nitrogen hydrolase family protein [Arthrobacter sp. NPDC089319]|uniref:carbon-nitrogen hydrolase family protein n=1 Tax=Arthrobacter sp. NPDC089319 TaxID=3155915 RepID=UPI0034216083
MTVVTAAQFAPTRNKANNLTAIERLVKAATRQGAEVVLFPEYSSWFPGQLSEQVSGNAEALDGPFVAAMSRLASQYKVTIAAGMLETVPDSDPRPYNTVVSVGPGGTLLACYRKVHLYDAFGSEESRWIRPGPLDQEPLFEHSGLIFGIQTCYDLRFPELSRLRSAAGASVLLVPAQWVPGPSKELHWTTLLRARAIENTAYVVAADHGPPAGIGLSAIYDPAGACIDSLFEPTGLATGTLTLEHIQGVRSENPALKMRRIDLPATAPRA